MICCCLQFVGSHSIGRQNLDGAPGWHPRRYRSVERRQELRARSEVRRVLKPSRESQLRTPPRSATRFVSDSLPPQPREFKVEEELPDEHLNSTSCGVLEQRSSCSCSSKYTRGASGTGLRCSEKGCQSSAEATSSGLSLPGVVGDYGTSCVCKANAAAGTLMTDASRPGAWAYYIEHGIGRGPTTAPAIQEITGLSCGNSSARSVHVGPWLGMGTASVVFRGAMSGCYGEAEDARTGHAAVQMLIPSDQARQEQEHTAPEARERAEWGTVLRLKALQGRPGVPALYAAGMCFGCQERRTTRVLAMELGYRVSWDHMPEPVFNFSSGVVEGSEAARLLAKHTIVKKCLAAVDPATCALQALLGAARMFAHLTERAGIVLEDIVAMWDDPAWPPQLKANQLALRNGTWDWLVIDLGVFEGSWKP
ncbi:hypothetical protein CYMTET_34848, partial [Cymbomonas tetramitiformis]